MCIQCGYHRNKLTPPTQSGDQNRHIDFAARTLSKAQTQHVHITALIQSQGGVDLNDNKSMHLD